VTRLLTAREVADLLGVSAETVLRWTRAGKLPSIKLPGGAIRFREEEIESWIGQRAAPRRGSVTHPEGRRPAGTVLRSKASPTPEDEE
jgi:excisionase family DNA binding protein